METYPSLVLPHIDNMKTYARACFSAIKTIVFGDIDITDSMKMVYRYNDTWYGCTHVKVTILFHRNNSSKISITACAGPVEYSLELDDFGMKSLVGIVNVRVCSNDGTSTLIATRRWTGKLPGVKEFVTKGEGSPNGLSALKTATSRAIEYIDNFYWELVATLD